MAINDVFNKIMSIFNAFKQNKKNKPTTCYDLLDPKMVVHILGGAWAKIDELEGNHSLTILKYFETYLSEYTNKLPKKSIFTNIFNDIIIPKIKSIPLINQIIPILKQYFKPEQKQPTLDITSLYKLKNFVIKLHEQVEHINQPFDQQINNIHNTIVTAVNKLNSNNNDMLIIPGGWSGLPADPQQGQSKYPGHTMYYYIKPDLKHSGKFIFGVINSGAGLEIYHNKQTTADGKTMYSPSIEWANLTKEQVTNPEMLEKLMAIQIIPLRYASLEHFKDEKRPYYNAIDIYEVLHEYLPKTNITQEATDWITKQRIGNCSWKSLMMVIRKLVGKEQYKKFLNDLKFNTLEILRDNLLNNPDKYSNYHFLMIKALRYGTQKIAKALEKRNRMFTKKELENKTNQAEILLQQANQLQQDYLSKHHGKLTDQILPNNLKKLKSNTLPSNVKTEQTHKIISHAIYALNAPTKPRQKIKPKTILIPKLKLYATKDFLLSLDECLKYASNINNPQVLRTFLTHHVFNYLPAPSSTNFWDQFNDNTKDNTNKILDCLKLLNNLSSLYATSISAEGPVLPEYKYNYAKVFSIGTALTKKYIQNSNALKNIKKNNQFALPYNLIKSFSQEARSLDPHSSVAWNHLKKAEKFNFKKLLYEADPLEPIGPKTFLEFPEAKLYQQLLQYDKTKHHTEDKIATDVAELMQHNTPALATLTQSKEQQILTNFIEIMQNFSIRNIYVANDSQPPGSLRFRMIKSPPYLEKVFFLTKLPKKIEKNSPEKKLFSHQTILPNIYLSALNDNNLNNADTNILSTRSQSNLLLDSSNDETYNIKLIANAPWQSQTQTIQLTLLLDYFESLPDNKQNDPNLLEFFKQITISHIDNSMAQLQQHPLLTNRLIAFFNQEFNKIADNLSKLEDLNGYINRYLGFQRIVHKIYSLLKEHQEQLTGIQQYIYKEFEKTLKNTRKQLLDWLTQSNLLLDKGQIAAYGLASFGHLQALSDQLSEEDLKTAIIFSTQIGIHGFGKHSEQYDCLLKKDLYDVRLKIAAQIATCSPALKQKLLNLCLQNLNIENNAWQESDPYYFTYNNNNDLIQINLTEGIILINGIQLTINNIPNNILYSAPYKKIFGEESIDVLQQDPYFIPQKPSLHNFTIKKASTNTNNVNIFWTPTNESDNSYILLQNLDDLQLPPSLANSDFSCWAKITNDPTKYKILITANTPGYEPQICFEMLTDGKIVKPSALMFSNLSLTSANNADPLLNFAINLGYTAKDLLTWQDPLGKIVKIEIPLSDTQGNWLSFDYKKQSDGTVRWYCSQDPNYYISSKQILYGKPSLSNFILLENTNGKQKALFAHIKEPGYIAATDPLKLSSIYPPVGKPTVKYIEIDINQSLSLPKSPAELITSSTIGDLSNLYIVYLKLIHSENEPYDASILLNKQRPLRRYSTEELELLWWIIESKNAQTSLNKELLHPDAVVTRLLAIYLIKSNLEKYPFSKEEEETFKLTNPLLSQKLLDQNTLIKLAQDNYQAMLELPKSSGRGKLNNFVSDTDLEILQLPYLKSSDQKKSYKKLSRPIAPKTALLQNHQITNIILEEQLLTKTAQQICKDINNLLKLNNTEQQNQLKRNRLHGSKYELTIDDAIYLYLKQNANLWEEYTGLTDTNEIHKIQDQIINYLLLKVKNQQKQRTYDPILYPAFLIYEALNNIMLRPEQIEQFKRLLADNGTHKEQQLEIIMGMGKSKVLSPLLSHAKADGKHLSVLVLTDPLYNSGSLDMQKSLSLLGARTETIEYSRQTNSIAKLKQLQSQINRAIEEGVVCTARVKDLQTINAMPEVLLEEIYQNKQSGTYTKQLQTELEEQINILLDINNTIKNKGLFTLDELDTQLYSRHQLNLPVGPEKSISSIGSSITTELFLMLLTKDFKEIPIKNWLLNNTQTFLSAEDFETKIKPQLLEQIFNNLNLKTNLDISLKIGFMSYMGVKPINQQAAEKFYNTLKTWHTTGTPTEKLLAERLAIYKMQLADGKLQEALSKCANTQFGRSKLQPNLEIAIPFAASNQPKESSSTECAFFKDPWETVNKTFIYYISSKWQDLDQTNNFMMFLRDYLKNDPKNNLLIKNIFGIKIFELLINDNLNTINNLTTIKNKIEEQRKAGNTDLFNLLFKYLNESIFPQQIKSYAIQVNSTPYDFAALPKILNGYSGTRRGEKTWHDRLTRDNLQDTEQKIHAQLLDQSKPNHNHCFSNIQTSDPAILMQYLQKHLKKLTKYSSFIDAGALFKELPNREVAKLLLKNLPLSKQAVAFYDEVSPGVIKLSLIKRDISGAPSAPIIIDGSSPEQIAKALNCTVKQLETKLFNFYDQAHIVGSDLPNPPKSRAFMTYSEQLSKDLMNQGIMRMRKFMESNGQHVDFLVPKNIKNIILKRLGIANTTLTLEHLINHAKLIQEEQEQQDYYNALHQKLQHEIKNYFTTKIRVLLNNNKHDAALALYKETRNFLLFLEEDDLFNKYGTTVKTTNPITALTHKVKFLKNKLNNLTLDKTELNKLKANLDKIINIDPRALPEQISSNALSEGEIEVSTEQQAELQQEQQQEQQYEQYLTPAKNSALGTPKPGTSYLEYLQTLDFNQTISLKKILSEKIALEKSPLIKKWQAYNKLIDNNDIYYSQDALQAFNEIDPVDGLFTKYQKPIHQILIVEEKVGENSKVKLIVLSAQESANFALSLKNAREEAKTNQTNNNILTNRKIWLVSPNGEALDGTVPWINPFKLENNYSKLLLQTLVLQQNSKVLAKLRTIFNDWFNNNKVNIEQIFTKEKFKELTIKTTQPYNQYNNIIFTHRFLQTAQHLETPPQPKLRRGFGVGKSL
jgi:hypothetical protein